MSVELPAERPAGSVDYQHLDATPYAEFRRLNATPQEFSSDEFLVPGDGRRTGLSSPVVWTLLGVATVGLVAAGARAAGWW